MTLSYTAAPVHNPADDALIRKVMRRLIPFTIICFILNYIDRVNVSIAETAIRKTIPDFSKEVFSSGLSIFFLGYFLFELPSNLIQQRVGPRRWIARIMISWGIISVGFMFIQGAWSFYILRFLLGFAEAGFFPGVILYLSYWVPHAYRARASALFLTSTAIAGVIGNPLGGTILYFTDKYPLWLHSWQWLFLIEGLPSLVLGVITYFYLTDRPGDARWLEPRERARLEEIMAGEHASHPAHHLSGLGDALRSFHTWMLSFLYGLIVFGFYTVNFYTPQIVRGALERAGTIVKASTQPDGLPGTPDYLGFLYVGLLSAIPFGAATIGMILIARHSDRTNERKFHLAFACGLIAVGLAITGVAPTLLSGTLATILTIAGLSVGAIGAFGIFGPFWALPPQFLTGTAVAASFAIINSLGNLFGGFLGPKSFSMLGNQRNSLLVAAGLAMLAAVLTILAPIPKHRAPE